MDSSKSKTIKTEENPRENHVDVENAVRSFGNFMLREDESSVRHEWTPAKEEHSSSSSSSSSSVYTLEKYQHAIDEIKSRNQCPAIQETSGTTQLLSDRCYGMWGNPSFWQRGESSSSNAHTNRAESVLDFFDDNAESYASGSSNQQSGLNSSYNNSSNSNLANQFISNDPFLYNSDPSFMPMRNIDSSERIQFNENQNNGLYSGHHEYYTDDSQIIFRVQQDLESGDYETIDNSLSTLQNYMFLIMKDEKMNFVFQKFIDACEGERLESVVRDLSLYNLLFIDAAFCRQGVHSIKKLIKKLKKTPHAFTLTTILSTRFLEMMSHDTARDVILKCLNLFGTGPNMILYEKALKHLPELATHQVGCRSLNECIDMIPCQYRSNLLIHIAYTSDFLSNDPFGNYVVQHVLGLRNEELTCIILQCLKGKFIDLATRKCGSHVVEKCMVSSKYGIVSVVQELLDCPKAAVQLAQHQFGNYVVQKALAKTKEQGFNGYHVSLVRSLEPHLAALNRTVGGKNVINCLKRLI